MRFTGPAVFRNGNGDENNGDDDGGSEPEPIVPKPEDDPPTPGDI